MTHTKKVAAKLLEVLIRNKRSKKQVSESASRYLINNVDANY